MIEMELAFKPKTKSALTFIYNKKPRNKYLNLG
jgi:hypothetical protein